ncbi:MAG TPA: aldolase/citrate lyase family protein [Bryobacteraceae bacterium]|nr:aldolase/citrate lyase family protein [Bryobacteraceae bacterium]
MALTSPTETLIEQLRHGACLGAWCSLASYACVELMASLEYDFILLDTEHSEITLANFPAYLGAFNGVRTQPIVRAPENTYHAINWLLDQGVPGVLVPMVNSPEAAVAAVRAAKFPPVGRRSFGPFRAARYGATLDTYMPTANERTAIIIQIEDARAAENVDDILGVSGLDAVFMGPNDLAYSMLKPGDTMRGDPKQWSAFARTPEVIALCEHVMKRCAAAGLPFGMTAASSEDAQSWLDRGAQFVTFGSDFMFLRAGWQQLGSRKASQ